MCANTQFNTAHKLIQLCLALRNNFLSTNIIRAVTSMCAKVMTECQCRKRQCHEC